MPRAGAGLHDRRVGGVQRAEYTVGVSGCDKRIVFTVICPDGGEGCFAAGSGR